MDLHACLHAHARAHTRTHTHTIMCKTLFSSRASGNLMSLYVYRAISCLCMCIVQLLSQRQRLIAAGGLVRDTGGGERASGDTTQNSAVAACFIPLAGGSSVEGREGGWGGSGEAEDLDWGGGGESLEDVLRRKTKEFNISTRERPSDVENWYRV